MNCPKNDPIQARLFMLEAAVAKADDTRPCLKHIYCDGDNIVSTDGKVLVFTKNDEALKTGFYDLVTTGTGRDKATKFVPVTDEKAKEWKYPNWKQVVPDCTNCKKVEFRGKAEIRELEVFKLQFALASMGAGSLIGQEYIDLVCKPQLTYDVKIVDGLVPVLFEVPCFYSVLVMPRRAAAGKSEVNKLLEAYKADVVAELKRTQDAETPEAAQDAPEVAPTAEPEPESAGEPAEPVAVAEPVDAPMPEPVELPPKARKAPKAAAKPKPKRNRKPTFAYICELKDGSHLTLDSIEAVRKRRDVLKCRIEPVKRSRKAA